MIFAFSGMDCAGKTTQIDLLCRHIRRRGYSPRVLWYRPGYSDELNQVRRMIRKMVPGRLPEPGDHQAKAQALSKTGIRAGWLAAAILDTLFHYSLKVRACSARGDIVICDRYVGDAEFDLQLAFPEASWIGPAMVAVRRACPRPDAWFVLELSFAEIERRMAIKNEPFPDAPELRPRRFQAYQALAQRGGATVLDASQSPEAIHEEIARIFDEVLP